MRGGGMARSSVSGANRASSGRSMDSSRGRDRVQSADRPGSGAGSELGSRQPPDGSMASRDRPGAGTLPAGDRTPGNRGDNANIDHGTLGDRDFDHDTWGGWHDVDIDIDGSRGDWDIDIDIDHHHPIAAAAAILTTAAIASNMYYYSLPYGCPWMDPYYYCDGFYYQEQMQGDDVVYVVVNPEGQPTQAPAEPVPPPGENPPR